MFLLRSSLRVGWVGVGLIHQKCNQSCAYCSAWYCSYRLHTGSLYDIGSLHSSRRGHSPANASGTSKAIDWAHHMSISRFTLSRSDGLTVPSVLLTAGHTAFEGRIRSGRLRVHHQNWRGFDRLPERLQLCSTADELDSAIFAYAAKMTRSSSTTSSLMTSLKRHRPALPRRSVPLHATSSPLTPGMSRSRSCRMDHVSAHGLRWSFQRRAM